ncbi:MAG: hypothetical protein JO364_08685 [Pseudonocardiales bacterium]|nr:hypothetical protein [Pseudonocardiales bacterium]MBV9030374.1 hypothetical protein [Pseudonocardiales bacterium]
MTAPSFTNSTLTISDRIGRYFSIVSMLPALFLALWTYALLASGAWSNAPDLKSLTARTNHLSPAGVAWLMVATLLVALFLHPFSFAMTQLLEGYWGSSSVAIGAMKPRIIHHRKRQRQLQERSDQHYDALRQRSNQLSEKKLMEDKQEGAARDGDDPDEWNGEESERKLIGILDSKLGDQLMVHVVSHEAARRRLKRYPEENRVMPTRLGNALRRFEDAAGSQYGLNAILTAPHFSLIAPDRHTQYLRDSRQQMDTTISLCTVSFLATIIAVVFLLTDGLWLLVALVPYALAYVAYRGAVAAADEYATAVTTVIDLNRFQLYESLRIDAPRDT